MFHYSRSRSGVSPRKTHPAMSKPNVYTGSYILQNIAGRDTMTATIMSIAKNRTSAKTIVDTKVEVARVTLVSMGAAGTVASL